MKYLNFLLIGGLCGSDPNGPTTEGVTDMVTSTVMPDMTASTVTPPATPEMSPEDAKREAANKALWDLDPDVRRQLMILLALRKSNYEAIEDKLRFMFAEELIPDNIQDVIALAHGVSPFRRT